MSKIQKLSPAKFGLLGFQHMFAMFGATVLVPTLTGLSVSATLLFAGLGTLLFTVLGSGAALSTGVVLVTKKRMSKIEDEE